MLKKSHVLGTQYGNKYLGLLTWKKHVYKIHVTLLLLGYQINITIA